MKQRIFMYLFIFSMLLVLFQYANSKRVFEAQNSKLENYQEQFAVYKDSVASLENKIMDLSHFNLERNEDALTYFENKGYNIDSLIPLIKDELYRLNEARGAHPIIPYASGEGKKMLINTVKLLNHKWIIADFSDGDYWGELFIAYEVNDDSELKFTLLDSFLYPTN